ncbi:DUF3021 domain-containing protein [Gracilibacillus thailandensis]|uniref:DUF3021 family protein n=1 Tax=Gracilibacillus thailandensis TaxID=563735 RepID=A0A6N7R5N2_9BACI|nr:DUF3021 domain-containing protein [Gracilibacillus thailandensis]MRI68559.1 DUF3021 family protein [Gracilibacillus thailandensis]
MIVEGLKRILYGVAAGSLVTFVILSLLVMQDIETTVQEIWKHWLASMLIGIYFSWASVIFERERWSILKQTIVHFVISIVVYFPIAIMAGWVPFNTKALLLGLGIFIGCYSIFWISFYSYFKRMARSMNECIDRKNE